MPGFAAGAAWIDDHPWMGAVMRPLRQAASPTAAEAQERLDALESELMKRGTLAHERIRWGWVGEESRQLMGEHSKDLRLLWFMLLAAPRCTGDPQLPLSAALAAGFLGAWGADAMPGQRRGKAVLTHIVDHLETLAAAPAGFAAPADRRATEAALAVIADRLAEGSPALATRIAAIKGRLQDEAQPPQEPQRASGAGADPQGSPPTPARPATAAAPPPDALRLEPDNERAVRQSLSLVAEFLLGLDPDHGLSYRLRRFATWYAITAAPPLKAAARTVLNPVAEDVAAGYRSLPERRAGDADSVLRLERSCHNNPFWLEGQWIAFRLASRCGRAEAAAAIVDETRRFLSRIGELDRLEFADGSPIVPEGVARWIEEADRPSSPAAAGADPIARAALEARECARAGDLREAIRLLDAAGRAATTPRCRAWNELATLECLCEWGMGAHAAGQAQRLAQALAGRTVGEWEPQFMDRLARLGGS